MILNYKPPIENIQRKDRARLLLAELIGRGYRFKIEYDYHMHSDKWIRDTYKKSGLLTIDVFRKTYGSGSKISKL
jgi:hypothetical protein